MNEYTVKVKNKRQNTTHKVNQLARSQQVANKRVLLYLRRAFGHRDFEVL
jgi:hypothetical protein